MGALTPCNWCAETARMKWDLTAQRGLYAAAKAITVALASAVLAECGRLPLT